MQKLPFKHKTQLSRLVFFIVILAVGFGINQVEVEAASQLDVTLEGRVDLTSGKALGQLQINLNNQSATDVVSNFQLPNVWGATRLVSSNFNQVSVTSRNIDINFSGDPLQPNNTAQLIIDFESDALVDLGGGNYYYQQGELLEANASSANINFRVGNFVVIYPNSWPELVHTNLRPDVYTLSSSTSSGRVAATTRFEVKDLFGLDLWWTESLEYNFRAVPTAEPRLLLRKGGNTKIEITNPEVLSGVYLDDSGNLFGAALNQVESELGESGQGDSEVSLDLRLTELEQVKSTTGLPNLLTEPQYPMPQELLELSLGGEDFATDLESVIAVVSQNYNLRPLTERELEVAEPSGPPPIGAELNYLEYLLLVLAKLNSADMPASVVVFDRNPLGGGIQFAFEHCAESCNYYKTDFLLPSYEQREDFSGGVQVLGFSGVNQLAFAELRSRVVTKNYELGLATSSVQGQSVLGVAANTNTSAQNQTSEPLINLNIPAEIENFSDFAAEISIENPSSEIIFLEALVIENNTFPIVEDYFSGLHEGVLPGSSARFEVQNVYLPRLILGASERETINVDVVYATENSQRILETSHSLFVRQNYGFVGLGAVMVFTAILSLGIIVTLYRHNKLQLMASYWETRRFVSEIGWKLGQLTNRR